MSERKHPKEKHDHKPEHQHEAQPPKKHPAPLKPQGHAAHGHAAASVLPPSPSLRELLHDVAQVAPGVSDHAFGEPRPRGHHVKPEDLHHKAHSAHPHHRNSHHDDVEIDIHTGHGVEIDVTLHPDGKHHAGHGHHHPKHPRRPAKHEKPHLPAVEEAPEKDEEGGIWGGGGGADSSVAEHTDDDATAAGDVVEGAVQASEDEDEGDAAELEAEADAAESQEAEDESSAAAEDEAAGTAKAARTKAPADSEEEDVDLKIDLDGDGDFDIEEEIHADGPVSIELHLQGAGKPGAKHKPHPTEKSPSHHKSSKKHGKNKTHTPGKESKRARDLRLIRVMKQHGIVSPALTLKTARKAGVHLSVACAVLQAETGGGHNVFGHDPVAAGQIVGGDVTRQRYLQYKKLRNQGRGNQGVGPMQLTSPGLQDQADALGGAWKPSVNLFVGMKYLHDCIKQAGNTWGGLKRYNGAASYANRVNGLVRKWHSWFMAGEPKGGKSGGGHRKHHPGGGKKPSHKGGSESPAGLDALALARKQLGYHEKGENINKFSKDLGRSAEKWCADFVSWCFIHSGHNLYGKNGSAAVSEVARWFKDKGHGHFHSPKVKPHVGWVVFFDYNNVRDTSSSNSHVGIVSSVSGRSFQVISGNSHDSVRYTSHTVGEADISGFGKY